MADLLAGVVLAAFMGCVLGAAVFEDDGLTAAEAALLELEAAAALLPTALVLDCVFAAAG